MSSDEFEELNLIKYILKFTFIKYKVQRQTRRIMSYPKVSSTINTSQFIKGMTLDQYMSHLNCDIPLNQQKQQQQKQQNLYQSSCKADPVKLQRNCRQYCIQEIDQESIDDSFEYPNQSEEEDKEKEQQTKATFRQTKEQHPNRFIRLDQHSMNATSYFNEPVHAANKFRVKNISNSPLLKINEGTVNGSMTLYGNKFSLEKGKLSNKINQLATFYGKLPVNFDKSPKKIHTKASQIKGESKTRLNKKNWLELDKLIEFQTKIKKNHSQRIYFPDIRIDGMKDKLAERKNKFA